MPASSCLGASGAPSPLAARAVAGRRRASRCRAAEEPRPQLPVSREDAERALRTAREAGESLLALLGARLSALAAEPPALPPLEDAPAALRALADSVEAAARSALAESEDGWLTEAGSARAAAKARALSLLAADRLAARREARLEAGQWEVEEAAREVAGQRAAALAALRAAREDAEALRLSTSWTPAVEGRFRRLAREAEAEAAAAPLPPLPAASAAPLGSLGALGALELEFAPVQPAGSSAEAEAEEEEDTAAAVDAILSNALSDMGLSEEAGQEEGAGTGTVRASAAQLEERMRAWVSKGGGAEEQARGGAA